MALTRILFLAANPTDTQALALDKEVRAVQNKLRGSGADEEIQLRSEWAVHAQDLPELLTAYRPQIVHFSCHGSPSGELLLTGANDDAVPVSTETLQRVFRQCSPGLRCVVLNACFSGQQATALLQVVPVVVAMASEIPDAVATIFAVGFYRAVASGENVHSAVELGRIQLELAKMSKYRDLPQLLYGEGVDPTKVTFRNAKNPVTQHPLGPASENKAFDDTQVITRRKALEADYRNRLAAALSSSDYFVEPLVLVRHRPVQAAVLNAPALLEQPVQTGFQSAAAFVMTSPLGLLLGPGGSGKSQLVRRLVLLAALTGEVRSGFDDPSACWQQQERALLPVLLPLTNCQGRERPIDLLGVAAAHAELHYGLAVEELQDLFARAHTDGRILFIGDGLNEIVHDEERLQVEHAFLAMHRQGFGNLFLLVSQQTLPLGTALKEHAARAELSGLSLLQVETFLTNAAKKGRLPGASEGDPLGPTGRSLLAEIREDLRLTEWAQFPQRLSMMMALKTSHNRNAPLTSSLAEFFEQYVQGRLESYATAASAKHTEHEVIVRARHHLASLALWMLQTGTFCAAAHVLKRQLIELIQGDATDLQSQAAAAQEADTLLRLLPARAELLVVDSLQRMAFAHSNFLFYFAAYRLAALDSEARWTILRNHLRDPNWREPLALCCGQLSLTSKGRVAARQLIQHLLDASSSAAENAQPELFIALTAVEAVGSADFTEAAALLDRLEPLCESPIPIVRSQSWQGVCQLTRLGNSDAMRLLLRMLERPRPSPQLIRETRVVVDEAPHGSVAMRVQELLSHRLPAVRAAAIGALERVILREATLRERIFTSLDSNDADIRAAAFHALLPLFSHDEETEKQLRQRLTADNLDAFHAAIREDGTLLIEDDKLRALVYQLLKDASARTRGTLLSLLAPRILNDLNDRLLLLNALQDPNPNIRFQVFGQLCILARFRTDIRDAVLQHIGGSWPDVSDLVATLQAMPQLKCLAFLNVADPIVWSVIRSKLSHPAQLVREQVINALAAWVEHIPSLANVLWTFVTDDSQACNTRQAAMLALLPVLRGREDWRPALIRRLGTRADNALVPMIQAAAIAVPKSALVRKRLKAMLHQDPPPITRIELLNALASHRSTNKMATVELLRMVADTEPTIKHNAFQRLAPWLKTEDLSHPDIQGCFCHPDVSIRRSAIEWLQRLGKEAISTHLCQAILRARLADDDAQVLLPTIALLLIASMTKPELFATCCLAAVRFNSTQTLPQVAIPEAWVLAVLERSKIRDELISALAAEAPKLATDLSNRLVQLKALSAQPHFRQQVIDHALEHNRPGIPFMAQWLPVMPSLSKQSHSEIISMLQTRVNSENPSMKEAAATVLLALGGGGAHDQISAILQDAASMPEQDARILSTVAQLTRPSPSIEQFITMLRDQDIQQRSLAILLLVRYPISDLYHAEMMLPWLGIVTESPRDLPRPLAAGEQINGAAIRRQIAELLAPLLRTEPRLRARVEAMLHSPRWQARQGAAWALSLMSGALTDEVSKQLCDVLQDTRSPDDDILEHLQAARALLAISTGTPTPPPSYLPLAEEGLRFGREFWELIPTWAREVRLCAVNLAAALPETTAGTKLLQQAQAEDPDEVVKEEAYRLLCSRAQPAMQRKTA